MDNFEEKQPSGESKFVRILSILAAVMAVAMYVAYIDQIQKTWGDATGPWIQPFVAGINCSLCSLWFPKERQRLSYCICQPSRYCTWLFSSILSCLLKRSIKLLKAALKTDSFFI